jgi:ketosteroid isomerase-like protein
MPVVALCCLTMSGQAQRSSKAPSQRGHMPRGQKHSYEKQVEQMEAQWRQAQLSVDPQMMERLLADDYIGITSTGLVVTKEEQLNRTRNRTAVLTRLDVSDVKVKVLGSTAIVTSRANVEGTNEGVAVNGMYRYTRVYGRLPNGTWKIVNFESTRIPSAGQKAP